MKPEMDERIAEIAKATMRSYPISEMQAYLSAEATVVVRREAVLRDAHAQGYEEIIDLLYRAVPDDVRVDGIDGGDKRDAVIRFNDLHDNKPEVIRAWFWRAFELTL